MKVVLVTGGFDPIHSGHINYFRKAKQLGDVLIVGINSDLWLSRKKGKSFMPWSERSEIVRSIKYVTNILDFNDNDNSAKDAIRKTRLLWPTATIIFANGGDRTKENIPEMEYKDDNLEFVFGVGGEYKMNSSSWILHGWKEAKTERQWGFYRVLYDHPGTKVKELVVEPGKSLSMQKHTHRNEYWHVSEGEGMLLYGDDSKIFLKKHDVVTIPTETWHKLENNSNKVLKIVEIQYGDKCEEEDIERK